MSLGDWRITVERNLSAFEQMARDEQLANEGDLALRLFCWDTPAISLGWKQPAPHWFQVDRWTQAGLQWVERPTGGGIAFHGSDLSMAVVVPRDLNLPLHALLAAVCRSTVYACEAAGAPASALLDAASGSRVMYCLTQTSPYAVMLESRKVAGFAIRRYPRSWLIQGSMLVRPVQDKLAEALPEIVRHDLRTRAVALSERAADAEEWPLALQLAASWPQWWEEAVLKSLGALA